MGNEELAPFLLNAGTEGIFGALAANLRASPGQKEIDMPTPIGSPFGVNTITAEYQTHPAIAALTDGRFILAWNDSSETGDDASDSAVRAQIFNADGSKSGNEFLVNTKTVDNQAHPTIAALADGKFAIAWQDTSATEDNDIRAQIFDASGSKLGAEFTVNTTTRGDQDLPAIAHLPDGRFVVTWDDFFYDASSDTSTHQIGAQLFNADGSKFGDEFIVTTNSESAFSGRHRAAGWALRRHLER